MRNIASARQIPDLSALSGRKGRSDATAFIARCILERLQPVDGTLIDIGCGDGTLLSLLEGPRGIGILPTPEEVARLRIACPDLDIRLGTAHETGLPDACADQVVVNGVLQLAPPLVNSLAEIRRIVRPGGQVYVGEMPSVDERTSRGALWMPRALYANFKRGGARLVLKALAWLAGSVAGGQWRTHVSKQLALAAPHEFATCAEAHGFELLSCEAHLLLRPDTSIRVLTTRFSYLLRAT